MSKDSLIPGQASASGDSGGGVTNIGQNVLPIGAGLAGLATPSHPIIWDPVEEKYTTEAALEVGEIITDPSTVYVSQNLGIQGSNLAFHLRDISGERTGFMVAYSYDENGSSRPYMRELKSSSTPPQQLTASTSTGVTASQHEFSPLANQLITKWSLRSVESGKATIKVRLDSHTGGVIFKVRDIEFAAGVDTVVFDSFNSKISPFFLAQGQAMYVEVDGVELKGVGTYGTDFNFYMTTEGMDWEKKELALLEDVTGGADEEIFVAIPEASTVYSPAKNNNLTVSNIAMSTNAPRLLVPQNFDYTSHVDTVIAAYAGSVAFKGRGTWGDLTFTSGGATLSALNKTRLTVNASISQLKSPNEANEIILTDGIALMQSSTLLGMNYQGYPVFRASDSGVTLTNQSGFGGIEINPTTGVVNAPSGISTSGKMTAGTGFESESGSFKSTNYVLVVENLDGNAVIQNVGGTTNIYSGTGDLNNYISISDSGIEFIENGSAKVF